MAMLTQEEQQESDGVELLAGMMGGDFGLEEARRVLRKHKGNVQKAAEAILGGDRGEDVSTLWNTSQISEEPLPADNASPSGVSQATQASSSTVIDLTSDDDDISRALQMSMETIPSEPTFRPTDRAPHPEWQMVPSNAPVESQATQDDRSLKDAIQASLDDLNADELEIFPVENTVREDNRPVALRPQVPGIVYAALVIQALFSVPQVRQSVANLQLPDIDVSLPRSSPDYAIWNLIELFVNMDLAQLSSIVDNEVLPSLRTNSWDGTTESLGNLTSEFLRHLGILIEVHLNAQHSDEDPDVCLFQFFHGKAEVRGNGWRYDKSANNRGSVVAVDVGDPTLPNDLVSRLAAMLSQYEDRGSTHDIIFEPSQVLTFHLKAPQDSSARSLDPFVYPRFLYLDRFLAKNFEIANQKRRLNREMQEEINTLTKQKEYITHYNNKDTIADLRASLHYYEHIADSKEDEARQDVITRMTKKLKDILSMMLKKLQEIDQKIGTLQAELAGLFDCPELQHYRYDLRAVLMHTGLPGRKQIYSYVRDQHDVWWKTVDYTVNEVPEETVLSDPTGLHLGAGPYLLVYSRHLSEEEMNVPLVWPKVFTDAVQENNKILRSLLSPEVATKSATTTGSTTTTATSSSTNSSISSLSDPSSREGQTHDVSSTNTSIQSMDITND